jgi:hypothetical protein
VFENFVFSSDGHGGTLVIDPPVANNDSVTSNSTSAETHGPVAPPATASLGQPSDGFQNHDILVGHLLTGLGGGDVFVFQSGAGPQATGVSIDSHPGHEVFNLPAFGFGQSQLQAVIAAATQGDHASTSAPNETAGISVAQLHASHDFALAHH